MFDKNEMEPDTTAQFSGGPMATGAFQQRKASALKFRPMMYMDEYLDDLTARPCNKDFVRTVKNALTHFANFVRDNDVMHPDEITRQHLVRFQAWCNQRVEDGTWKKTYAVSVLTKVQGWLNWMEQLDYIITNPWTRIKLPNFKKTAKPLSEDDLHALFHVHQQDAFRLLPFHFHRRDVVLTLLFAWGLRIHELEAMDVEHVDMRLDFVTVRNKGGGTKVEPFTDEIKKVVQRWLFARSRYAQVGENALLITANGGRLPIEQIRQMIYDLGERAGVRVNPHRFRDTCITELLDHNVPVERVQQVAGHSDIRRTLSYATVDQRRVYESFQHAMDPFLVDLFDNTRNLR